MEGVLGLILDTWCCWLFWVIYLVWYNWRYLVAKLNQWVAPTPLRSDHEEAETVRMESLPALTPPPSYQSVSGESNELSSRTGESTPQVEQLRNVGTEFTRSEQSLLALFDESMEPYRFSPIQVMPYGANIPPIISHEIYNLRLQENVDNNLTFERVGFVDFRTEGIDDYFIFDGNDSDVSLDVEIESVSISSVSTDSGRGSCIVTLSV